MTTKNTNLKDRTKLFANQLTRCSTSVGANYRAASRAKSGADFINKLKIEASIKTARRNNS